MNTEEGLIKLATFQLQRLEGMNPETFEMEKQRQENIKYYQQQIKELKNESSN